MSHAHGVVLGPENVVLGWYEYNGTSDIACPRVFETSEELQENWRKLAVEWLTCSCGGEPESVTIATSYGKGFGWPGKWCPRCRCLTDGLDPFDDALSGLCRDDLWPWKDEKGFATFPQDEP